ncbi:hypothetical protein [Rhodohalobacter mucosus]|uniref:Uncharacterized protein n=1 Tax=Rhodohalobacter mucosus TaxID=2079485 RepID=A0A316TKP5_9BACT|nr:hypothetical protein [Rhodohalobacter mucosus]PWN05107.1 hypothetical protein DDZ15_16260 [Rhodohalobacter mucosus]
MNRYNTLYYLLILLLITGAFASMAQNGYGIKLMGGVAAAFSLLFLVQAVDYVQTGKSKIFPLIELVSLAVLAGIISLRVFYIHFPYVELMYGLAGICLLVVYAIKLSKIFPQIREENSFLSWMVLLFFGSLVLFILSLTLTPFSPGLAEPAGMAAFVLILFFALASIAKNEVLYQGENVNALKIATREEPRAVMILSIFMLFSLYIGMNRVNLIPSIYSDEYPRAYFELVNRAETGNEEPVDGQYRHDRFQQEYEEFIEKHTDTFEY